MLLERGHHVEVFAGSRDRAGTFVEDGLTQHRVIERSHRRFSAAVAPVFAARHREVVFDVVEGPDYGADAAQIVSEFPELAFLLRLHAPSGVILDLNYRESNFWRSVSLAFRSLFHGRPPTWRVPHEYWRKSRSLRRYDRLEGAQSKVADVVASPSEALGEKLVKRWRFDGDRLMVLPNAFRPGPELLSIEIDGHLKSVVFIGRLMRGKGVLEVAAAIPDILEAHPGTTFRFVGPTDESPQKGVDMRTYLEELLRPFGDSVVFTGPVPMARIPEELANSDVVVLPSRWENFPYACLEAMAAGRGIVASRSGGMREQLDEGLVGELVDPGDPTQLVTAVGKLLGDPQRRMRLGAAARERVLARYSYEALGELYEEAYRLAISRRAGAILRIASGK